MKKMSDIRNSFVRMRGGKLISIEAYILACVVAFILTVVKNVNPYLSLVIAFIVGFVFPILVGTFKSLAWIAAILFSLIWSFMGFLIVAAIAGGSVFIGLLGAAVLFAISFVVHKNYSGISFQKISRKSNTLEELSPNNYYAEESVMFCPKCGRRVKSVNGRCDVCDK